MTDDEKLSRFVIQELNVSLDPTTAHGVIIGYGTKDGLTTADGTLLMGGNGSLFNHIKRKSKRTKPTTRKTKSRRNRKSRATRRK
jgi:hypothetical protein